MNLTHKRKKKSEILKLSKKMKELYFHFAPGKSIIIKFSKQKIYTKQVDGFDVANYILIGQKNGFFRFSQRSELVYQFRSDGGGNLGGNDALWFTDGDANTEGFRREATNMTPNGFRVIIYYEDPLRGLRKLFVEFERVIVAVLKEEMPFNIGAEFEFDDDEDEDDESGGKKKKKKKKKEKEKQYSGKKRKGRQQKYDDDDDDDDDDDEDPDEPPKKKSKYEK